MKKNILIYRWGSACERPFIRELDRLNISYSEFDEELKDYHADSRFAAEMIQILQDRNVEAAFSFDYFPLLSMICEIRQIPYISWIYDCPMLTLESKTLENGRNYIYCFDRLYTKRLERQGAKHCFHLPLAGNGELLDRIRKSEENGSIQKKKYCCDISFLGNLYNGNKNRYRTAGFKEHTKGFLEGVIEAQLKIYGYNFVKEIFTDDVVSEITEKCRLQLGDMYRQDFRQMAADVINMEISARERERLLQKISTEYPLTLYTGSALPEGLKNTNVINRGFADYDAEMPYIFHNSKINLNITSKSIESGVPLRVFDILSCGGFCLTNYQSEIAELFEDGKELVMYTDEEDMLNKIQYYLSHDGERKNIAYNGYAKFKSKHTLSDKIKILFD